jgi:hypothetical protein
MITHRNPTMCSALYSRHPNIPFQLPRGCWYEEYALDAQLPNQFRCQTSKLPGRFAGKTRPEAVETSRTL